MVDDKSQESPCEGLAEEEIDEALAETFPASDPPQWTWVSTIIATTRRNEKANASTKKIRPLKK